MGLLKLSTTHHSETALPVDDVVNTLYVNTGAGVAPQAVVDDVVDALLAFWRDPVAPANLSVQNLLSSALDRDELPLIEVYEKQDGERLFGSPRLRVSMLNPDPPVTANQLPNEVALVLSFHGDLTDVPEEEGTTRPAARRRGRIYVGPLSFGVMAPNETGGPTPTQDAINTLVGAASRFHNAIEAIPGAFWVVVHAVDTVGWQSHPVVGGWVDNEFDTQRRRGKAATGRTTFAP